MLLQGFIFHLSGFVLEQRPIEHGVVIKFAHSEQVLKKPNAEVRIVGLGIERQIATVFEILNELIGTTLAQLSHAGRPLDFADCVLKFNLTF